MALEEKSVFTHDAEELKDDSSPAPKNRRKFIILGLALTGAVVVALAVALGVGLSRRCSGTCDSSSSSPIQVVNTSTTAPRIVAGAKWKPKAGTTWQYALSVSPPSLADNVEVYDIDLFDTTRETITALHAAGRKVVCYFSAGTYENWRPDASSFLPADKGLPLDDWVGETWINTGSKNVRNIMRARIIMAVAKGCDGIDPDNVDGYSNDSGLPLTKSTAINYMFYLATQAHSRGLAIGLKNAGAILPKVVGSMDFAVNEQCLQYDECQSFQPFIAAGKPVFHVEYPDDAPQTTLAEKNTICTGAGETGFSTIIKNLDLDDWAMNC